VKVRSAVSSGDISNCTTNVQYEGKQDRPPPGNMFYCITFNEMTLVTEVTGIIVFISIAQLNLN